MAVRIFQDTLSPSLADTITAGGAQVDLTGATVRFRMRPVGSSTLKVDQAAAVITPAAGTVRYDWQAVDVDTPGDYLGWWRVTLPSSKVIESPEFLVIVAAHTAARLCTLAEVKAADRTGLTNVGQADDDLIETLITDASDVIMEWAGRRYTLDAAPSARLFHVAGGVVDVGDLSAAPTLVRALHPDGSLVAALTATDYRVEPLIRAATDPITAIRLLAGPAYHGGLLEVTGVWGWPTVPRRAARACVLTVVQWLRDGRALTPQSPDQIEPGGQTARMLPLPAREILQMDRRIGVA